MGLPASVLTYLFGLLFSTVYDYHNCTVLQLCLRGFLLPREYFTLEHQLEIVRLGVVEVGQIFNVLSDCSGGFVGQFDGFAVACGELEFYHRHPQNNYMVI